MPNIIGKLLLVPARWLFDRFFLRAGITMDLLLRTKYEARELEVALREVFQARTLEHACTKIIIPSVDLLAGKPVVFKSPHLQDACTRDKTFSAVQIALATAAAPTYFPHAELREGSAYCDGGLWANNPILIAIAEAQRIFAEREDNDFAGLKLEDVEVLSIGTGRGKFSLAPPDSAAGLVWWGTRVLDVMSLSQAAGANSTAEFMLPGRIHRVDFELPDNTWKLDSVEYVERLVHLGREAAHEHIAQLRTRFFSPVQSVSAA